MAKCKAEVRGALTVSFCDSWSRDNDANGWCVCQPPWDSHHSAYFYFTGSCKYCSHSVDEAETLPALSDMLFSWHHGVPPLCVIQARLIHG